MADLENQIPLDFGEMDIHCNRDDYYDCEKIAIDRILNTKITILGCQQTKIQDATKPNGERKPVVIHILLNGKEYKVFTNSKMIREQLDKIREKYNGFPRFEAKIVKEKAKYYRLASAKDAG